MRIALVSPFSSSYADGNFKTWAKAWPEKAKYEEQLRGGKKKPVPREICLYSKTTPKGLTDFVSADDVVYIVGHCASGHDALSSGVPFSVKQRTPSAEAQKVTYQQLADIIKDTLRLPPSFPGRVKLLACEAAAGGKKAFLDQFVGVMRPHYSNVHFGGYTEVLQVGHDAMRKKIVVGVGGQHVNDVAATIARWFCPATCQKHKQGGD